MKKRTLNDRKPKGESFIFKFSRWGKRNEKRLWHYSRFCFCFGCVLLRKIESLPNRMKTWRIAPALKRIKDVLPTLFYNGRKWEQMHDQRDWTNESTGY